MTRWSIRPSDSSVCTSGPVRPCSRLRPAFGDSEGLPPLERVEVGYDDLGFVDVGQHVWWNELAALVVAVRVIGLQYSQPVADGDARRHDQEPARKVLAVGPANGVDGLPGDQHRHHGGLARAGGELERQPRQAGIRLLVGARQVIEEDPLLASALRRNLGEPDERLHRFDLAKEGSNLTEAVGAPVLEQPSCLGGDLPVGGIRDQAPLVHSPP